jgi:hypothetical protein
LLSGTCFAILSCIVSDFSELNSVPFRAFTSLADQLMAGKVTVAVVFAGTVTSYTILFAVEFPCRFDFAVQSDSNSALALVKTSSGMRSQHKMFVARIGLIDLNSGHISGTATRLLPRRHNG